jgi:hypothetical protein
MCCAQMSLEAWVFCMASIIWLHEQLCNRALYHGVLFWTSTSLSGTIYTASLYNDYNYAHSEKLLCS